MNLIEAKGIFKTKIYEYKTISKIARISNIAFRSHWMISRPINTHFTLVNNWYNGNDALKFKISLAAIFIILDQEPTEKLLQNKTACTSLYSLLKM